MTTESKRDNHERDQGERLHRSRQRLDQASFAYTSPLSQREQRGHRRGNSCRVAPQGREYRVREFTNDQRYSCGRPAGQEPIAPSNDESGVLTERVSGEGVLPSRLRNHRSEFGKLKCAEQGVQPADCPRRHEQRSRGQMCRNLARRPKDPRPDRDADAERNCEAYAEYGVERIGGGATS